MTQAPPPSPLATPEPWGMVAPDYAAELAPAFEAFAREALRLSGVAAGMHVVDVAAGPGTLSLLAARAGASVAALDFAPEMVEILRRRASGEGLAGVEAVVGDGTALPFADGSFDAGFSMFGLMFFSDRGKGFRELLRVLKPGAPAVVSSWVSLERVPLFGAFFGALAEVVPGTAPPPGGLPLSDPEACRRETAEAGFEGVAVHESAIELAFPSTGALIEWFTKTSAPLVLLRRRLGEGAWGEAMGSLGARFVERVGAGPQRLTMPALLTLGRRGRP